MNSVAEFTTKIQIWQVLFITPQPKLRRPGSIPKTRILSHSSAIKKE